METKAFATFSPDGEFVAHNIERRQLRAEDVSITIQYCGICHSDLHTARSEWGPAQYPCVPGHEIIGIVERVGSSVTKFKEGDMVGVGCMVDSCRQCSSCDSGLEQYCKEGFTGTYGSQLRGTDEPVSYTMGGYSQNIVVAEAFVLRLPKGLDPASSAPLLCAGITTFSPLKHVGLRAGHKIGVLGLGGLGHMAVKIAKSFGAEVSVLSRSVHKKQDAQKLGANHFILTTDKQELAAHLEEFDFIIDTVSAPHNLTEALILLKQEGTLIMVGASDKPIDLSVFPMILRRRKILGSLIGGIEETQQMLEHCAKHEITSDIELINPDQINQAYERMLASDVKYRFVIDCRKM